MDWRFGLEALAGACGQEVLRSPLFLHALPLPLPAEAALTSLRLGTGCGPSRDGDQSPWPSQPHSALPAQ